MNTTPPGRAIRGFVMAGHRRPQTRFMAVALAAGIALAGCGTSDDAAGSESGDLIVGAMVALTGPGASSGTGEVAGANARFAQVNAAGGIDGHQIVLESADDQLDPAKAPAAARTLVESKNVLALGMSGSADSAAILPYLAAKDVLSVPTSGSTPLIEPPESTFREFVPSYGELGAAVTEYAVKELGKKRIAVAYTPDAVGEPTLAGVKAVLKKLDLPLVASVSFSASATSAAAQAAKLKESDADFVVLIHVAATASVLMKSAEQIGYQPTYGSAFPLANPTLTDIMGSALDGRIYFATPYNTPDSDEAKDFREWAGKAKADIHDTNVMSGWVNGDVLVEVLTRAVDLADGKVPSREQVLAAATDITIDTPYVRGVTWSDTERSGTKEAQILALTNGTFTSARGFETVPIG